MKNLFNIALTVVALICAALSYSPSAQAGAYTLLGGGATSTNYLLTGIANTYAISTDTTSGLYTNGIAVGTGTGGTATFISVINAKDVDFAVNAYCANTSATNVTACVTYYQSVDSFNWTNSLQTNYILIPATTTNWLVGNLHITGASEFYAVRKIELAPAFSGATLTFTNINVKAFTKNGI